MAEKLCKKKKIKCYVHIYYFLFTMAQYIINIKKRCFGQINTYANYLGIDITSPFSLLDLERDTACTPTSLDGQHHYSCMIGKVRNKHDTHLTSE